MARGIDSPVEQSSVCLEDHHAAVCRGDRITASMAREVAAVRCFVRWMRRRLRHVAGARERPAWSLDADELAEVYPSVAAVTTRPHPPLSSLDLGRVFKTIEAPTFRLGQLRDGVAVAFMLCLGLRRAEVTGLDVRDLVRGPESAGGWVLTVRGKGGKEGGVPVPDGVVGLLRRYLKATGRTVDSSGPLIARLRRPAGGGDAQGIGGASVYMMARSLFERAGVSRPVSAHGLRRTFAQLCKQAGLSVVDLQGLMRHGSEAVTARYARTLDSTELVQWMPDLPGRRRR